MHAICGSLLSVCFSTSFSRKTAVEDGKDAAKATRCAVRQRARVMSSGRSRPAGQLS